jgi:hypothetical protein
MGTNNPVVQHHIPEECVIKYFEIIHCPFIFASFLFTKIETKIESFLQQLEVGNHTRYIVWGTLYFHLDM